MGTKKTLTTAEQVAKELRKKPQTIAEVAKLLEKSERSVYRAIKELKASGLQLARTGDHGAYRWEVRRRRAHA